MKNKLISKTFRTADNTSIFYPIVTTTFRNKNYKVSKILWMIALPLAGVIALVIFFSSTNQVIQNICGIALGAIISSYIPLLINKSTDKLNDEFAKIDYAIYKTKEHIQQFRKPYTAINDTNYTRRVIDEPQISLFTLLDICSDILSDADLNSDNLKLSWNHQSYNLKDLQQLLFDKIQSNTITKADCDNANFLIDEIILDFTNYLTKLYRYKMYIYDYSKTCYATPEDCESNKHE